MFARAYFARRFFARRYWANLGGLLTPAPEVILVTDATLVGSTALQAQLVDSRATSVRLE